MAKFRIENWKPKFKPKIISHLRARDPDFRVSSSPPEGGGGGGGVWEYTFAVY